MLTVGVFALAGLLFFTSFNTAKGTNIRTDASLLKLSDLIQERSQKNGRLDESNGSLREDVESLAKRTAGGDFGADAARLSALEKNAGTRPLKGGAVTVTLDDAPPDATAKLPGYPEPQPDYLVIHQQDLQAVVNALWKGGARGIKVMDQRLIGTSAVRCVGNTLILQGRVYSPPTRSPRSATRRSSRARWPPRPPSRTTWSTSTSTGSAGRSPRTETSRCPATRARWTCTTPSPWSDTGPRKPCTVTVK